MKATSTNLHWNEIRVNLRLLKTRLKKGEPPWLAFLSPNASAQLFFANGLRGSFSSRMAVL